MYLKALAAKEVVKCIKFIVLILRARTHRFDKTFIIVKEIQLQNVLLNVPLHHAAL